MFHQCRNQVAGFYKQNVWKYLWKSNILSKDAGHPQVKYSHLDS